VGAKGVGGVTLDGFHGREREGAADFVVCAIGIPRALEVAYICREEVVPRGDGKGIYFVLVVVALFFGLPGVEIDFLGCEFQDIVECSYIEAVGAGSREGDVDCRGGGLSDCRGGDNEFFYEAAFFVFRQ